MKVNKLSESLCKDINERYDLSEEVLVEGPISWIKDKIDPEGADKRALAKADKQQAKAKKKAPVILSKDFDSRNARSRFYVNNNYNAPMSQAQWRKWFEDSRGQENESAVDDARYNAIVVDQNGFYMRRGAEDMETKALKFLPGENDEITSGYHTDSYKYNKVKSKGGTSINNTDIDKFKNICTLTGLTVIDSKNKEVDVRKINLNDLSSYKVKVGNVQVSVTDWIDRAKSKKLI